MNLDVMCTIRKKSTRLSIQWKNSFSFDISAPLSYVSSKPRCKFDNHLFQYDQQLLNKSNVNTFVVDTVSSNESNT